MRPAVHEQYPIKTSAVYFIDTASPIAQKAGEIFNPRLPLPHKSQQMLRAIGNRIRTVAAFTNDPQSPHGLPEPERGETFALTQDFARHFQEKQRRKSKKRFTIQEALQSVIQRAKLEGYIPAQTDFRRSVRYSNIISGGRKLIIEPPAISWGEALGTRLPDAVDGSTHFRLSAKGTYSPVRPLTDKVLKDTTMIEGLTGFDTDFSFSRLFTENIHEVTDLYGKRIKKRLVLGRYLLMAIPMDHIYRTSPFDINLISATPQSAKKIDLNNSAEISQYALLRDKDKPHVLFYANWTDYNYRDVISLAKIIKSKYDFDNTAGNNLQNFMEGRRLLTGMFTDIMTDLSSHPDFHDALQSLRLTRTNNDFLIQFLSSYVLAQANKDFTDSQIVAQLGFQVNNRTTHNSAFGGIQDLDSAFHFRQSNEYAMGTLEPADKVKKNLQHNLFTIQQENMYELIRQVGFLLTPKERTAIVTAITSTLTQASLYAADASPHLSNQAKLTERSLNGETLNFGYAVHYTKRQ